MLVQHCTNVIQMLCVCRVVHRAVYYIGCSADNRPTHQRDIDLRPAIGRDPDLDQSQT